jgi:hypothetical protein
MSSLVVPLQRSQTIHIHLSCCGSEKNCSQEQNKKRKRNSQTVSVLLEEESGSKESASDSEREEDLTDDVKTALKTLKTIEKLGFKPVPFEKLCE